MALAYNEQLVNGFVVEKVTGALSVTFDTTNATIRNGFLRDPDGRIVVRGG